MADTNQDPNHKKCRGICNRRAKVGSIPGSSVAERDSTNPRSTSGGERSKSGPQAMHSQAARLCPAGSRRCSRGGQHHAGAARRPISPLG